MNASNLDHEALTEVIRQSQRRSWLYRHRFMSVFVGIPTLLAIIYYAFIATPIYVSFSSFVIKSPNQRPTQSLSLANIVQTTGLGMGGEQTKEILQYLRSRNALNDLQTKLDVRKLYADRGADIFSRFPKPFGGATFEDLFRYYNKRVNAEIDSESSMAVLQVQAFTPEDAHAINAQLLDLSEALVNRLNQRAENRAISEAERRLLQAEERVRNARVSLSAFRNQSNIIDPERQAQGVLEISNRLVTEQAALQAQLDLMLQVAPQNPAIPALRERIVAIGTAIEKQNSRAVGSPRAISSKLATFEKLQVEQEFATQMLTAANTSLEQARTESQKQQFYLERVVEPNRPDDPAMPNGLRQVLTVLGASLCLYFIGWMLVVGILEHSPED
jgi:capsular polysaccharide transport system permease protein